ncbi:hypothetical protein AWB81_07774 [Caballeronia arationis]|jgi:hypothetical protein|uniref:Uncharacterized protein n=1 Tax=Caballeronia arationis TaxID=1777142 RepID=A0A7Z7I1I9_9BURK|nr:hypothetical protein AWB81_07774 [Caballeronia arationis]SOE50276.1 hypothetical protein SAMN05446927_0412 [Caballeronia arationis]
MTERQRFSNEARPKMLTIGRGYSTNDFTALSAHVQRIPPAVWSAPTTVGRDSQLLQTDGRAVSP